MQGLQEEQVLAGARSGGMRLHVLILLGVLSLTPSHVTEQMAAFVCPGYGNRLIQCKLDKD